MGINDGKASVASQASSALGQQSDNNQSMNQQRQQQQQQPQNDVWNFHGGSIFGAPIGRSAGSENLTKLTEALSEIYKNANDMAEMSLISIDRTNEPALAFSVLIVAMRIKTDLEAGVAYHVLIVEATGDRPGPVFENYNGQQVEVSRVSSDAMDQKLLDICETRLASAFPKSRRYFVDGCVIPMEFNMDDKTRVYNVALNAALACGNELKMRSSGFMDLNLARVGRDSNLVINVGFDRKCVEDSVGNPMRSDVLINFSSQKNQNQKNQSLNSGDREARIAQLSGFVDLVWNPVSQQSGLMHQAMLNPALMATMTQRYSPRLIITNLTSEVAFTPASVLLALYTAFALNDDNNWIQAFRPNTGIDGVDVSDIGALNIEANIYGEPNGVGTRVDTKSDNFRLEDLGRYVSAMVQRDLILSLDVPEYGAQSWYLSMFLAAANRNQSAYATIIAGANQLTNGAFDKYFPNGGEIFTDVGNRVHLGYWIDKHGIRRDIRDIDTIAVANIFGERNPQAVRDWSDTFLRTQIPLPMREAGRKKMISATTNESAVFTGRAQRLTFTGQFLDALSRSIKDTGMAVNVATPLSSMDFQNSRGVASFASAAAMSQGSSFVRPAAFGYQPQQFGNFGGARWG